VLKWLRKLLKALGMLGELGTDFGLVMTQNEFQSLTKIAINHLGPSMSGTCSKLGFLLPFPLLTTAELV